MVALEIRTAQDGMPSDWALVTATTARIPKKLFISAKLVREGKYVLLQLSNFGAKEK